MTATICPTCGQDKDSTNDRAYLCSNAIHLPEPRLVPFDGEVESWPPDEPDNGSTDDACT